MATAEQTELERIMAILNPPANAPVNWWMQPQQPAQPLATPYGTPATGAVPTALQPQPPATTGAPVTQPAPTTGATAGQGTTEQGAQVTAAPVATQVSTTAVPAKIVAPPQPPTGTPTTPAPTPAPVWDPTKGAPSYYDPRYSSGPSTAGSLEELARQQALYTEYLNRAGVRDPVTGTNTQATSGGQQPIFKPVEPFWETPATSFPPNVEKGIDRMTGTFFGPGDAPTTGATGPGPSLPFFNPASAPTTGGTGPGTEIPSLAPQPSATERMREFATTFGTYGGGSSPYSRVGSVFDPSLDPIDPNNSLRGRRILPQSDPRLDATSGAVDRMRDQLTGYDLGTFSPVGGGRVSDYLYESIQNARQGGVNARGPIGSTDLSAVMAAIQRAQQAYGGTQGGPIGQSDVSGARAAYDRAGTDIARADVSSLPGIGRSDTSGAMAALDRARNYTSAADPNYLAWAQARDQASRRLKGLEGPDRGELARRTFDLIDRESEPQFQEDLRDVGRAAATFGRIGSGVTTSRVGDVLSERERLRTNAKERLALEAAGLSLDDRLNALDATLGASGQFTSEDLGRAGFNLSRSSEERAIGGQLEGIARGNRAEDVGERGFRAGQDMDRAGLALSRAGAEQSRGGALEGVARRSRDELLGERGYATDTGFRRGAAEQGVGAQLEGMGRATRAEQVGERTYGTETDALKARLALERSGALSGLAGQEYGQQQGLRNEARGERDAGLDRLLSTLNAKRGVLGDVAGLEGQQFAQGQGVRNEIRTERDFENMLARLAQGDRIQKLQLEDELLNSEFGRWLSQAGLFADVGYGGNPADAYFRRANYGG